MNYLKMLEVCPLLMSSFVRRHDDGLVRAVTCSLIHNKYHELDVNGFNIILVKPIGFTDDASHRNCALMFLHTGLQCTVLSYLFVVLVLGLFIDDFSVCHMKYLPNFI